MIIWAGRILTFLGIFHMVTTLAMTTNFLDDWFTMALWFPDGGLTNMNPATGAFWLTIGSFGVPLALLGLAVTLLARNGITPPAYLAWTLGAWGTVAAIVFEPSPWLATWAPSIMLLVAARRHRSRRGAERSARSLMADGD